MLLNLASVVNAETPDILWGFIRALQPERHAGGHAVPGQAGRVRAGVLPRLRRARGSSSAQPDATERAALTDLAAELARLAPETPAEDIQNVIYEVGKRHPFAELRAWFGCLYQVLLGQTEGPRFGQFVALYGIAETVALIAAALERTPLAEPADAG